MRRKNPSQVILLGASNLTRGLPVVTAWIRSRLGGAVDFRVAAGHGRAYAVPSRFLIRGLGSIAECGLWRVLDEVPTLALFADIGNDIAYGVSPAEAVLRVEECLDRLHDDSRVVMVVPSSERLKLLSPASFHLFRRLFFPGHEVEYTEILESVEELCDLLEKLSEGRRLAVVRPPREWYGADPIHFRRSLVEDIWGQVLGHWCLDEAPGRASGEHGLAGDSLSERWQLLWSRSERWTVLGRTRRRPQPCVRWRDGSRASLY